MDPRDLFSFLRRRWLVVFIMTVLALGIAGFQTSKNEGDRGALIFVTMGMEMPEVTSADFYVTNESHNVIDQFTETVQGWLFNPSLLEDINVEAGQRVQLSVRKQEKQNLLVTVTVPIDGDVDAASSAVLIVLDRELAAYNRMTNAHFLVAGSSVNAFENSPTHALDLAVGGFVGLIVGILCAVGGEYARRRLSFAFQVASWMNKAPLVRLPHALSSHDIEKAVALCGKKFPEPRPWVELGNSGLRSLKSGQELFSYPEDLKKLNVDRSFIVVIHLGVTSEDALQEWVNVFGTTGEYILIV